MIAMHGVIAARWDRRVEKWAKDGTITNGKLIAAMDKFINNLKNDSNGDLTSEFYAFYPMVTDTAVSNAAKLDQMKINLINPGTYNGTFTNNPTADSYGVDWNGTSQYMDTGIMPSSVFNTTDFNSYLYYSLENTAMSSVDLECGSAGNLILIRRSTNQSGCQMDGGSSIAAYRSAIGTDATAGLGAYIGSLRTSQTFFMKNGTRVFQNTSAGNTIAYSGSYTVHLGRHNSGSPVYTNKKCAGFAVMKGITEAKATAISTHVNNLQADIETALGLGSGTRKMY